MGFQLPELPPSIKDPAIKEFLEKYYEVSNTGHAHDEHTDLFTKDGEFSMNGKKAKGDKGNYDAFSGLFHLPSCFQHPSQFPFPVFYCSPY